MVPMEMRPCDVSILSLSSTAVAPAILTAPLARRS
jgi:hypothetical protein